MGGPGSGRRWGSASYGLTSDSLHLDIRTIKRKGCLILGRTFTWCWTWQHSGKTNSVNFRVYTDRLELNYRSLSPSKEWRPLNYPVYFSKSNCHLGGERTWFICPGKGCINRVAILYGGKYFLCRKCAGLVYASQRETALYRSIRRMDNIRDRLKWNPGFLNGPEWKPKGLHWATYWKYRREYDQLEKQALSKMDFI